MPVEILTLNADLYLKSWASQGEAAWNAIWDEIQPRIEEGAVAVLQEMPYHADAGKDHFMKIVNKDLNAYDVLYRVELAEQKLTNLIVAKPNKIKNAQGVEIVSGRANRFVPFQINVDDEWFDALAIHAHGGAEEVTEKLTELAGRQFKPQLIIGDFNAGKGINNQTGCATYEKMLQDYSLDDACDINGEELATFTAGTPIDHILYRRDGDLLADPATIIREPNELSDHALISCNIKRPQQ